MTLRTNRALWSAKLKGKVLPASKVLSIKHPANFQGSILGVDPSLRSTGLGLVQFQKDILPNLIYHKTLKLKGSFEECLAEILTHMETLTQTYSIDEAAIESVIYAQNTKTAQSLGGVNGVISAVLTKAAIPIANYAPRRIKKALTGFGGATKEQMVLTLKNQLKLTETLSFDEADAVATALCHAHSKLSYL